MTSYKSSRVHIKSEHRTRPAGNENWLARKEKLLVQYIVKEEKNTQTCNDMRIMKIACARKNDVVIKVKNYVKNMFTLKWICMFFD